jgi:hypothetical protein
VIEFACDRKPGIEVSATSGTHSRVQSSITARMRNLRPSIIWSCTKSSDQRSFPPLAYTVDCLEMDAGFPVYGASPAISRFMTSAFGARLV